MKHPESEIITARHTECPDCGRVVRVSVNGVMYRHRSDTKPLCQSKVVRI